MTAKNVEDVYELTPLQHGILFHCLSAPDSGVYVEQAYLTLGGHLDHDAFWRAWQTVIDRHPVLRTAFHWDGINKPVQTVHRHATLTRHEVDWRDLEQSEQDTRLEAFLLAERRRGFDLERPPLLNITLFRLADDRYYLAWRICHLIADGWSFGMIISEFIASYRAYFHGDEPVLGVPGAFRDYVAWWKAREPADVEGYWRDYLAGYTPPAPLDLGRAEQFADADVPYERRELSLAPIAGQLRAFAAEHRLTLHTLIQAAWMLVLSRCQRAEEVVVGATMAHRPQGLPHGEAIVGPMVVTLPIRSAVDPDRPLLDWLRDVQDDIVAARDHAGAPLTDIRGWSTVARSADLFESIVSFENVPIPEIVFPDEGLELIDYTFDGRPQYPLSFVVLPGDDLPLRLIYDRRRFRGLAVRQLLERVRVALDGFLAGPTSSVGGVEIMTEDERRKLDERWLPRRREPVTAGLPDLVAAHAAARPDRIALSGEAGALTYGELDGRANQLARHLDALGIGPGTRVAICGERNASTILAMLAVLKTGGSFVPLDPTHPAERLSYAVTDSAATVLLADTATAEIAGKIVADAPTGVETVLLDADWPGIAERSADPLDRRSAPTDEAYVVYTSGSTGTPKGVIMTQANVVRLVRSMSSVMDVGPDDTWTCFHTFAFDASVWEIWGALLNGSRLIVIPYWMTRSADSFYELLVTERVTIALNTPRAFEQLIAAEALADQRLRDGFAVRYFLIGADRVEPTALRPWFERHGDQHPQVLNVYGPTETTVFCTSHRITTEEAAAPAAPSNIGVPVEDTVFYLVDDRLRPVPVGVPGEICISSPGTGLGYLNLPELTRDRFVPDPFGGDPDAMIYRTGDLARYDDAGELEFLGRMDNQVKIRGFRVELGEIESVLREHPSVRNAAAMLREDTPGNPRLVAYVTPERPDAPPTDNALREALRHKLPDYMIPAALVMLDEIPLNANGKLDPRLLPSPDTLRGDAPYAQPRSDTERHLAALMTELLGVDRIGIDDNLLDLGLHSLLATTVAARIRDEWHTTVPLRALFDNPTVAAIARLIESGGADGVLADRPGQVDLVTEVTLDEDIVPAGARRSGPVERILLTGGTGSLGGALLASLLRGTAAQVVCLVRADTPEDGTRRLMANLREQGLWDEAFADRIVALPGTLSSARFGLTPRRFAELGAEIDEIHHCGALVNFLQPYRKLKSANVGGTREVLRLATTGDPTPVHYVSTGAVLGQFDGSSGEVPVALETELASTPPLLSGGYAQSKWVAERVVSLAARRGVPVTVHRAGRITGDSGTGAWKTGDATSEMMRACAYLGTVPAFEGAVDMTPIDYVAAAITTLARSDDVAGRIFHLTNPRPVSTAVLGAGMELAGYPVREVSVPEWYASLVRLARTDRTLDWALALAILGTWVHNYQNGRREPVYDSAVTASTLNGILTCPAVDDELIARYLRRFAETGYVPTPDAATATATTSA